MWRSVIIICESEEETISLGRRLGNLAHKGDVILIHGTLGAGKTRLAKGIVNQITGIPEHEVVSPTFTLVNNYEGPINVRHVDLYRLSPESVGGLGLDDEMEEGDLTVVEWPDRLQGITGKELVITIHFHGSSDSRTIELKWTKDGPWSERFDVEFSESTNSEPANMNA